LVIDNELNAMIGRILAGIAITDDTIALEAIQSVGPGGNYLKTVHTRRTWRQEQYLPTLADRLSYETWQAQGGRDMAARARERARQLVRDHSVVPLPEEQDRELARLLKRVEREKLASAA
jgi:trimethylamine--corrinoid protein Co-methyltransferase